MGVIVTVLVVVIVLMGAMRGPVVTIVFARAAQLDLQGRMVDAETLVQLTVQPVDEGVVVAGVGTRPVSYTHLTLPTILLV